MLLVLFTTATFLLSGCNDFTTSDAVDDLGLANAAYEQHEIADAEMYYERFLRRNPDSSERWAVWNKLLNIALNIRQDKTMAVAYLQIMNEEFAAKGEERRRIELTLASLLNDLREYSDSLSVWEKLAGDPDILPEDRALALRNISHLALRNLDFSKAVSVLETCLRLPVNDEEKSLCRFDLAEAQTLLGDLHESEINLKTILETTGRDQEKDVVIRFLLADVLEQEKKYDEAMEQLERIRTSYPNPKVIEVRISALKKNLKKNK